MSNRCYICDWSQSNSKSLYHPEIEDYGSTQLNTMEDGKDVCTRCQHQINKMKPKDSDTELSKYLIDHDIYELEMFQEESEKEGAQAVYDPIIGQFSGNRKSAIRYD